MKNGLLSRALLSVKYPTRDTIHYTEAGGGGGSGVGDGYNIRFKSGQL